MMRILLLACFLSTSISSYSEGASKKRILIGSPIRQKPTILHEFLASLNRLEQTSFTADHYFIDDNTDIESQKILNNFYQKNKKATYIVKPPPSSTPYNCNESTHHWNNPLIWKVAQFKNSIIEYAIKNNYDYLFLIDSDLVLHPKTIEQLISTKKDIVSNIFWTNWTPESPLLPQVWISDQYTLYKKKPGEQLSQQEAQKRQLQFLRQLRVPGTYEVGGLGACTLINKYALEKGVNFQRINNITLWGEDRHFCVRAKSLGLDLFVDTHFPAFHIYRESALPYVENFKRSCAQSTKNATSPRLTLSLVMKNEASRYLKRVLEEAKHYITDAVIIDDASTDNSVEVCESILSDIPHTIIKNKISKFNNEINLRKQQWEETIKTNPDWILFLDADEILEKNFRNRVTALLSEPSITAYYFRLYDLWDEDHYREDVYWQAHKRHSPFLVKYLPEIPYYWLNESPQHCGRFPSTVYTQLGCVSNLRVKHYGWAKEKDRVAKFLRYKSLDPEGKYGIPEQYNSILDSNPHLIRWIE